MTDSPSPNGGNGRDGRGRFTHGNPGGPGNPHGRHVARLRSLIHEVVTDDDLREIVGVLVSQAKGGDLRAIRELLDRVVGRPVDAPDPDAVALHAARLDQELLEAEAKAAELRESRAIQERFALPDRLP